MVRLDNRGFTLVEVLAVIVILGVLSTILVFSVTGLLKKGEEDNYNSLRNSIISAARVYISDKRSDIVLDSTDKCDNDNRYRRIATVDGKVINSMLSVKILVDDKLLSTGEIVNPKKKGQKLDLNGSYVYVKYSCDTREYIYGCFDDDSCSSLFKSHLDWKNS